MSRFQDRDLPRTYVILPQPHPNGSTCVWCGTAHVWCDTAINYSGWTHTTKYNPTPPPKPTQPNATHTNPTQPNTTQQNPRHPTPTHVNTTQLSTQHNTTRRNTTQPNSAVGVVVDVNVSVMHYVDENAEGGTMLNVPDGGANPPLVAFVEDLQVSCFLFKGTPIFLLNGTPRFLFYSSTMTFYLFHSRAFLLNPRVRLYYALVV